MENKLEEIERILIEGLQARDRELTERFIAPLRDDYAKVFKAIEERLGLAEGAIGSTHTINFDTMKVEKVDEC